MTSRQTRTLGIRARRAYEMGRVRRGLARAALAAPLVTAAVGAGGSPATCLATGGALAVLVVASTWWGGVAARAADVGMAAGLAPFAAAIVLPWAGSQQPGSGLLDGCLLPMAAAGVACGAAIAMYALREPRRYTALLVCGAVATLVGLSSCAHLGWTGVAGLVLGLVGGAVLALSLATARPNRRD